MSPGASGPHRSGAAGRRVPRPPVGRPPRHRRRDLPPPRRGLHRGPDHRAGLHLCHLHGHPPVHPHPRPLRHRPAGDRLRPRPGGHGLRRHRRRAARGDERDRPRHRRHRPGRGQHLPSSWSNGATRSGPWPAPGPTPARWSTWGSTSSPGTSPTPTTCCGRPPACDSAIHCAALLGGASQDLELFRAVNVGGTAQRARCRPRPWACAGWWPSAPGPSSTPRAASSGRTRPSSTKPSSDPYTVTKMAAFEDAMARAAAGQDVVTTHPGRHLRALPGGQQRAGPDQLQPGPARRPSASGSSPTCGSR